MWSGDNFEALRRESGVNLDVISEATGIPKSSLCAYTQGRVAPSLSALMSIADYFAVPLDYLVGRMPKDKAKELVEHYSQTFMELRKAPYEAYLSGRRQMKKTGGKYGEGPWPYNLLDDIFNEPWEEVLNADQKDGLCYAISTLDERTRACLYRYYCDGKTLDKVGTEHGITRERVRQIISRACAMLRKPSSAIYIKLGYEAASECVRLNEAARRLADVERRLDAKQGALEQRQKALDRWDTALKECADEREEITLNDLDLTVRAYNILRRKGARNLRDVAEILDSGKFNTFRGVGRTTLEEVVVKVSNITGKDYGEVYGI